MMTAESRKGDPGSFDGLLIIDKPEGLTSHDVVARLRKILRTKRIGHTGTLDPFATGVLVILVGKATRLARYLDKDAKTYEARLRFGFETETGDKTGRRRRETGVDDEGTGVEGQGAGLEVQESGDGGIDLASREELMSRIEAVLAEFTGAIVQIPPMYSAKKIKGKKLYELAREGVEVERKPIDVSIYELRIEDSDGVDASEIQLKIKCSAGTYIRTLAEDIGRRIGVPCHLSALRRTSAGRFELENSLTLDEIKSAAESGDVQTHILPINEAVAHLPFQTLDDGELKSISHGMKIYGSEDIGSVQTVRLISASGELAAIGEIEPGGGIQPKVVFISE
ncbi:MAG: tRNA pseudouridine(55) synthase TruB [Acidobacteriota bacterium]|nr:tRNA pseudouridine(55) synthase TruB [Acidobacteriota bacterium]MDH3528608.1 tRNA pseudouridine(55) synthase TruB [Acidobacteriota bacterium]